MLGFLQRLKAADQGERAVLALERIANALERLVPPEVHLPDVRQATLSMVTDEELWEREQEAERLSQ